MIHTVVIASESTKGNPIPLLPNNISISNRKLATRKTAPTAKRTAWPDVCVPCLESNLRPSDSTRRKQTLWKRGRIRQRRFVPQVPPNPRITPPKLTSLTWRNESLCHVYPYDFLFVPGQVNESNDGTLCTLHQCYVYV